ncbi:MAG: protein adenylyltransferase SelO family protein [Corynebacterium sp.]|uniref:protein adenylyltransferase SelO n=1 Tax=Corynebacterium sp. TaxID=1720 RepID=UPI0026DFE54A|nr:protein adenylyltransferase SelO family protein [Corynebacterium sp.]MDO5670961.1 protein adenylyltransferase SelO family protein [Corynebacterium sp.]
MNAPHLDHSYADAFPELVHAAHAEEQPDPQLVVLNTDLASELGIDPEWLQSEEGLQFLLGRGGNRTVAMGYAGHQFGQLSPRLGDGRALLLGEIKGRDLHAKGTGPTVFSRGGDGRGALGPMLREYLVSEAMHALGVPTTRALAVISTGRKIMRTGTVPGAVLVRTAASHLRVGTVQYSRLISQDMDLTERLCTYARKRHYPELNTHAEFFAGVMDAQIATVATWMRLGFIHGVMNTDNTTLSGETIDYGPCAFLDRFDPATFFSSIDTHGRYAFNNQPPILGWNLARLAEAMVPLLEIEDAQEIMNTFPQRWEKAQAAELARTLGTQDSGIAERWLQLLETHSPDLTDTHRLLNDDPDTIPDAEWVADWRALNPEPMGHPFHIPRNHLLDAALRAAEAGDTAPFHELLDVVTTPFNDHGEQFRGPAPEEFSSMFRTFCGT